MQHDTARSFHFRIYFHEFILQKIRDKPRDRVWIKDVSNGRFELFGNVNDAVKKISSGLSKLGESTFMNAFGGAAFLYLTIPFSR